MDCSGSDQGWSPLTWELWPVWGGMSFLPALGFVRRGCVCLRMCAQELIIPTRATFNYTKTSSAEARILVKGPLCSHPLNADLPLNWITPKLPKSNGICSDKTEVVGVREGDGEQQTLYSIQRFSLIKDAGCKGGLTPDIYLKHFECIECL